MGDNDKGGSACWDVGCDLVCARTKFNLHGGVIAKLGVFFLETFDQFQDCVLWWFHFVLGGRFI